MASYHIMALSVVILSFVSLICTFQSCTEFSCHSLSYFFDCTMNGVNAVHDVFNHLQAEKHLVYFSLTAFLNALLIIKLYIIMHSFSKHDFIHILLKTDYRLGITEIN